MLPHSFCSAAALSLAHAVLLLNRHLVPAAHLRLQRRFPAGGGGGTQSRSVRMSLHSHSRPKGVQCRPKC